MIRFVVSPLVGLVVFSILLLVFRKICFIIARHNHIKLDDNKFFKGLDGDTICYYAFLTIFLVIFSMGGYYILLNLGDFVLKIL